jgi:hypothetical protein
MGSRVVSLIVLVLFSFKSFSQVPLLENTKDGAYASFANFESGLPVMAVDSVELQIMENLGGNLLLLPLNPFEDIWAIVYKGHLFTRRSQNVRVTDLPLAMFPFGGTMATVKKSETAFVRILRYGKLCLSMDNTLIKLPHRRDYELTIPQFKKLIEDDEILLQQFVREKDKKIMIYKYIDLYNQRHTQVLYGRSDSDN